MRSKGAVDVSRVAVALGGGGHRLAAGLHRCHGDAARRSWLAAIRDELLDDQPHLSPCLPSQLTGPTLNGSACCHLRSASRTAGKLVADSGT